MLLRNHRVNSYFHFGLQIREESDCVNCRLYSNISLPFSRSEIAACIRDTVLCESCVRDIRLLAWPWSAGVVSYYQASLGLMWHTMSNVFRYGNC